MNKIILLTVMLLMSSYAYAKYNIGDTITNFEWEHSNGIDPRSTVSLDELTGEGKVVVLEFSQGWCGPCNMVAPHLEHVWQNWGGLGNDELYICAALTQNGDSSPMSWEQLDGSAWRGKHNLTHWLGKNQLYAFLDELGTYQGGIPHACIIDPQGMLFWGGNPSEAEFEEKIHEAMYSGHNLHPNFDYTIPAQELFIEEQTEFNLSEVFVTDDNSDWTVNIESLSNESTVSCQIDGKNITITAKEVGAATITLQAVCGEETAQASFDVIVGDNTLNWMEWGSDFSSGHSSGLSTNPWKAAVDFDFGDLEIDITALEIGMKDAEAGMKWKIVTTEDGKPTDNVLGDLEGTFDAIEGNGTIIDVNSDTKLTGHIALVVETQGNRCFLDKEATSDHTWINIQDKWMLANDWLNHINGAWYLKIGVNEIPGDVAAPLIKNINGTYTLTDSDMNITLELTDDTGVSAVTGKIDIEGNETNIPFQAVEKGKNKNRAVYTYAGVIPATEQAYSGTIKFELSDTSSPVNTRMTAPHDITCKEIPWEACIVEGFEGESFPPEGWLSVDNDGDSFDWYSASVTNVHSGHTYATSASMDKTKGYLEPDNWLITPQIKDPADISYWVSAQDLTWSKEHYAVCVSTTGTDIADFQQIFSETMSAKACGSWYERTIDLSAYKDQEIYLAFRHFNCTGYLRLNLDDIIVRAGHEAITPDLIPHTVTLKQNYPNPFNPSTTIEYQINSTNNVNILVFNAAGEQLWASGSRKQETGKHTIQFDGSKYNSGIYFYALEIDGVMQGKRKMMLIK